MLARNWLLIAAVGGLLGGTFAFGGCAVLCGGKDEPYRDGHKDQRTSATQPESEKEPSFPAGITIIGIETKKSAAEEREDKSSKERQEQREIRDVSAQETMALAACAMVGLTVVQIIVGGVTIAFLYFTLTEARNTAGATLSAAQATEKAAVATEKAVRLERAYVFGGPGKQEPLMEILKLRNMPEGQHRTGVRIKITIANYGKTTAFVKEVYGAFSMECDLEPTPKFAAGDRRWVDMVLAPDHQIHVVRFPPQFEFRCLEPHVFYGMIVYEDVFRETHRSRFIHRVFPNYIGDKSQKAVVPLENWPAYTEWD